jgi:hypothetical protein
MEIARRDSSSNHYHSSPSTDRHHFGENRALDCYRIGTSADAFIRKRAEYQCDLRPGIVVMAFEDPFLLVVVRESLNLIKAISRLILD